MALAGLDASRARTVAALALVAGFPLLLGSVVLTRFDLYPAALVVAALAALVHGRDRLGCGLLGAAVAVKLYPAVLVPLAVAYVWRRRGRREALTSASRSQPRVVVAVFLPFLVLAPAQVAHSIGRQLSRPLQIESLGSALFLAAHHLLGLRRRDALRPRLAEPPRDGTAVAAVLLSVVQVATCSSGSGSVRPGTPAELVRWSAAALVAFVALGQGALAAVPDLARPGRAARRRPPRAQGIWPAGRFTRADAALVPLALLGSRARARPAAVDARARSATSSWSPCSSS